MGGKKIATLPNVLFAAKVVKIKAQGLSLFRFFSNDFQVRAQSFSKPTNKLGISMLKILSRVPLGYYKNMTALAKEIPNMRSNYSKC